MKDKQTFSEQRRHPRYPVTENPNYSIYFRVSKEDDLNKASSINISKGGMMITSVEPHRPQSRIEVVIFYADDAQPAVFLQGIVCWLSKVPETEDEMKGYFVGIQFSGISELQESSLDKFMETCILDQ